MPTSKPLRKKMLCHLLFIQMFISPKLYATVSTILHRVYGTRISKRSKAYYLDNFPGKTTQQCHKFWQGTLIISCNNCARKAVSSPQRYFQFPSYSNY